MTKVKFYTFGCKVNNYETEVIREQLQSNEWFVTDDFLSADLVIINSCSVTSVSEKKIRQLIRKIKREHESCIIIVVGCYSQSDPEKLLDLGVNVVVGTKNRNYILKIVSDVKDGKIDKYARLNLVCLDGKNHFLEQGLTNYASRSRADVKVQDGCDNFCTYCVIPYLRGKPVSRNFESIIQEVKNLASCGFKEIVLVGINLAKYGYGNKTLVDIINEIDKVDGIKRIRLSSIDMIFFSDQNIEQLKHSKKLCPHFHISLQNGCNSVLNRMGRKYVIHEYIAVLDKLRLVWNDVEFTTDVIVGFPDETNDEFNVTLENINKCNFLGVHAFRYSRRNMTAADMLVRNNVWTLVDERIKKERLNQVVNLSLSNKIKRLTHYIGKTLTVLFEDDKSGFTSNYLRVNLATNNINNHNIVGNLQDVKITKLNVNGDGLVGVLVD